MSIIDKIIKENKLKPKDKEIEKKIKEIMNLREEQILNYAKLKDIQTRIWEDLPAEYRIERKGMSNADIKKRYKNTKILRQSVKNKTYSINIKDIIKSFPEYFKEV
ncbi:MAG TPA: hypothetical protein PL042_01695 [Caldisericia bacterium]|nr:hypothetical protein [Caldisericia bacterium]